jgi:hypothetical protein
MLDISNETKKFFFAVLQSVADLHKTEAEIENDKSLFLKITDFLTDNAVEIGKFQAVKDEMVDYLQNFSFMGNIDFTPVKNQLIPLLPIRQKLAQMGEEAKKLARKPDRYNCFRAMEVCKQLALFCSKEMKSTDYDKVTEALEKNIPALLKIQQEFEIENKILADIKEIIKKHNTVKKYAAFNVELQQFVAGFPHNRDSDLKTVEQYLSVLEDINKRVEEIDKQWAIVENYADRHNKNAVAIQTRATLSFVFMSMCFADMSSSKSNLQKQLSALENLITAFVDEQRETVALRDKLKNKSPDLWQEDNEQLISELDSIIKKGTTTSIFVLQNFYSRVQSATIKRLQDISLVEQKYKWLRRSRYVYGLNNLKNRCISFSNFQLEIKIIRKSRGLFTKLIEAIFYN